MTESIYCFGHYDFLPAAEFEDVIREHKPKLCKKCELARKNKQAKKDRTARRNSFNDAMKKPKKKTEAETKKVNNEKTDTRRAVEDILGQKSRYEESHL